MGSISLAQATSRRAGTPNALRVGTVVSVSADGVTVDVGGGEVLCGLVGGAGAGVAPGATVSVFKQGDSWQVQGTTAGGGAQSGAGLTNSTILPPVPGSGQPGAVVATSSLNLVTGLTTGAGSLYLNRTVTVVLPAGHLCEITCRNVQILATAAAYSTFLTIRDGNNPAGNVRASAVPYAPVAGNSTSADLSGWFIGDGGQYTFGLCAASLTASGSVSVSQSVSLPLFMGVIDWGDASGVTRV